MDKIIYVMRITGLTIPFLEFVQDAEVAPSAEETFMVFWPKMWANGQRHNAQELAKLKAAFEDEYSIVDLVVE